MSKDIKSEGSRDVRKGFHISVSSHIDAINNFSPEEIRFQIADALERLRDGRRPLQEDVDFSLTVSRVYTASSLSDDLYSAYLLGCEDECIPEPKTQEEFMRMWHDGANYGGEAPSIENRGLGSGN